MLWEWVTGKRLFVADSVAKTIEAVRSRYVEPPSILQSAVPPGWTRSRCAFSAAIPAAATRRPTSWSLRWMRC